MTSGRLKSRSGNARSLPDMSKIEHVTEIQSKYTDKEKPTRPSMFGKLLRYVSNPGSKRHSMPSSPISPVSSDVGSMCMVSHIIENEKQKKIKRVQLCKESLNEQYGLFIRDGFNRGISEEGDTPRVPGIFVSRFVPGGLAERSGLLGVNDQVLEINGIPVKGRSLIDVYKLMSSTSYTMVLTVKTF